jgi:hypothetical protein
MDSFGFAYATAQLALETAQWNAKQGETVANDEE